MQGKLFEIMFTLICHLELINAIYYNFGIVIYNPRVFTYKSEHWSSAVSASILSEKLLRWF